MGLAQAVGTVACITPDVIGECDTSRARLQQAMQQRGSLMRVTLRPILIADDDELGRTLTRRFLERIDVANPLVEAVDGDEVIAYLERAIAGEVAVPALMILDENMPGHTGRDILRWRGTHNELSDVPVFLLTGAAVGSDIDVVLGATFLWKPVSLGEFEAAIAEVDLGA